MSFSLLKSQLRCSHSMLRLARPIGIIGGRMLSTFSELQYLKVSSPANGVSLIELNRPKAYNALCTPLINELNQVLGVLRTDKDIGAVVLTGSEKAFAAGADIKEMKDFTLEECIANDFIKSWSNLKEFPKPLIAAVNGFALGGGCELAMSCDIIYAGENAKFGQPEITIGVIPGAGGTQRLIRSIGKSRAMEYILSGRQFNAKQAEDWGLVSKVFATDKVVDEAVQLASEISNFGGASVRKAKEAINLANEVSLSAGLQHERSVFHSLFATKDQKEGMSAFVEKRKPNFEKL